MTLHARRAEDRNAEGEARPDAGGGREAGRSEDSSGLEQDRGGAGGQHHARYVGQGGEGAGREGAGSAEVRFRQRISRRCGEAGGAGAGEEEAGQEEAGEVKWKPIPSTPRRFTSEDGA